MSGGMVGPARSGGICEGERSHSADRITPVSECVPEQFADTCAVWPHAPVAATSAAGIDIGDRVNHALKSCALQCTVYIPPGNYSFSATIHLELNPFGKYKLSGDPGAVLTYTGSGDAITTPVEQPGRIFPAADRRFSAQRESTCRRRNPHRCRPTGSPSAIWSSPDFPAGDGILVEGTNSSNIYDNLISNNKNGIRLIPTVCSAASRSSVEHR